MKEIDEMKQEASKILFKTFLKRVEKVTLNNLYLIHTVNTLDQFVKIIKMKCIETDITIHLMDFLEVKQIH